jgi:hypothetical protein
MSKGNPAGGSLTPAASSTSQPPGTEASSTIPTGTLPALSKPLDGPGSLIYASAAGVEGTRFTSVDQVLRFDVTKDWVYRNWARKSTGPTDVGLFAVRVPLVTGTQLTSVAGSLTYFFNTQGQVEHISFHGRTGDSTELVNFLVRTYGFQRVESPVGQQHYQVKRGQRVQSELRTHTESVLWSTSPHSSVALELELARPGSQRFLPPRAPNLEIPQVASTAPATPAASDDPASKTASGLESYFEGFRHATPQEEGQVLWKRWPN